MPEQTQKEIIEAEVNKAIAREVEAYRKTVESHQVFIEKGTKYFAIAVSTLAAIASAFFVYFFKHSVREAVHETIDKSEVLDASKSQITNSLFSFTTTQIAGALKQIDQATIAHVEEIKNTTLRQQVMSALANFPRDQLTNLINSVPAGTIAAYGGDIVAQQTGWLVCDGSEKSQSQYPELFKAIGTKWGKGDSADKFKLPNLQGMFLRGVDLGGTNDPDRMIRANWQGQQVGPIVGSYQPDALQGHGHLMIARMYGAGGGGQWPTFYQDGKMPQDNHWATAPSGVITTPETLQPFGEVHISSETRPKNAYVYYIIKY